MKITVRSTTSVSAADEGKTYSITELDEEAFNRAIQSDYVINMMYDSLLDVQDEQINALKSFVSSVYCQFVRGSEFGDQGYPEVELNQYGEDLFNVAALDPYTGHMEDIPEAETNGHYMSSALADEWNSSVRPNLQAQVDAINDTVDGYLSQNEDDDAAIETLWIEGESPVSDAMNSLKRQYVDAVNDMVQDKNDEIAREFTDHVESTEYLVDLLDANDVRFTQDGDLAL